MLRYTTDDMTDKSYVYCYIDTDGKLGGWREPKSFTTPQLIDYLTKNIDVKQNKYPSMYEEVNFGTSIRHYFDLEITVDKCFIDKDAIERFYKRHKKALIKYHGCGKKVISAFNSCGPYDGKAAIKKETKNAIDKYYSYLPTSIDDYTPTGKNYKISFHYIIDTNKYTTGDDIKKEVKSINKKYKCFFDESIYKSVGSAQRFRNPYTTKFGDQRVLQYINDKLTDYEYEHEKVVPWSKEVASMYHKWLVQLPTTKKVIKLMIKGVSKKVKTSNGQIVDHNAWIAYNKLPTSEDGSDSDCDSDSDVSDCDSDSDISDVETSEVEHKVELEIKKPTIDDELQTENVELQIKNVELAIMGLAEQRYTNRDDWMKMIFALGDLASKYPEYKGRLNALIHRFSAQTKGIYDYNETQKFFDTAVEKQKDGITKSTIYHFLAEDNPVLKTQIDESEGRNNILPIDVMLSGDNIDPLFAEVPFDVFDDIIEINKIRREKKVPIQGNVLVKLIKSTMVRVTNGGQAGLYTKQKVNNGSIFPEYKYNQISPLSINDFDEELGVNNPYYNPKEKESKKNQKLLKTGSFADVYNFVKRKGVVPQRRVATFIPYYKTDPQPENLNLFTGFAVLKALEKRPDITSEKFKNSLLYKHWKTQLCAGDERVFNYLMKYIAHMIQKPDERPDANIVLFSAQGAGKNTMMRFLANLIGVMYYSTYDSKETMLSRFNIDQMYNLMMVLEEMPTHDKEGKNTSNQMKNRTDATMMRFEKKFGDTVFAAVFTRIFFLTNNRNAIYVEGGDRRYVMLDCLNDFNDQKDYFAPMQEELKDPEMYLSACKFFTTEFDVENFKKETIPKTAYHTEQMMNGLRPHIKFLEYVAGGGVKTTPNYKLITRVDEKTKEVTVHANADELWKEFERWVSENKVRTNINGLQFKEELIHCGLLEKLTKPFKPRIDGEQRYIMGYKINSIKFAELFAKKYRVEQSVIQKRIDDINDDEDSGLDSDIDE